MADGLLKGNPARAVKALPEGRTKGRRGNSLTKNEFIKFVLSKEGQEIVVQDGFGPLPAPAIEAELKKLQ